LLNPDHLASFALPDGTLLRAGDPVVTYVSRNLEPYRGFHAFMRAVPDILKNTKARIVIVGGDSVSYGAMPRDARNWREKMLREVQPDLARVHFMGQIPYDSYRRLLQVYAAHVYLTYPFVLSWSMLEAMASGCLIVGSATPPMQEIVAHGRNGLLTDFFDAPMLAAMVAEVLDTPSRYAQMRSVASREIREGYSVEQGLKRYEELITG
jgi:glycosyltransferase involved in cell wall biosynthesis